MATNAPLVELRLASAIRRYERIKVALTAVVLLLVLVGNALLLGAASSNHSLLANQHESLVILRCAVARTTQVDETGQPRSSDAVREAFDKCVKAG